MELARSATRDESMAELVAARHRDALQDYRKCRVKIKPACDPEVFQDMTRANSYFVKDANFYQAISTPGTLIGKIDPARHRLRRSILSPAFTGSRVQELAPDVLRKTEQLMTRFDDASRRRAPICVNAAIKAFTMDIICQILLSKDPNLPDRLDYNGISDALSFSVKDRLIYSVLYFPAPCYRLKSNALLKNSLSTIPSNRRSPVIDRLIDRNAVEKSAPLCLDELNNELVMRMIASNNTTSDALIFKVYNIYLFLILQAPYTWGQRSLRVYWSLPGNPLKSHNYLNPTGSGPSDPIKSHVPGIYKFTATALGASMWFFVRVSPLFSHGYPCYHVAVVRKSLSQCTPPSDPKPKRRQSLVAQHNENRHFGRELARKPASQADRLQRVYPEVLQRLVQVLVLVLRRYAAAQLGRHAHQAPQQRQ
ncbi:hypothetical protein E0Z10_g7005 [Xylaria hypoxylon]|uniref:Cytochrome P450 n=1 Tax=Xylaria hypoxylon TaxID=37992 RepID=A0A4Z0YTJ8_9PEZI|nr:hypothetical protein E0Z10_g7005 [Xylaria hypoxylon]